MPPSDRKGSLPINFCLPKGALPQAPEMMMTRRPEKYINIFNTIIFNTAFFYLNTLLFYFLVSFFIIIYAMLKIFVFKKFSVKHGSPQTGRYP